MTDFYDREGDFVLLKVEDGQTVFYNEDPLGESVESTEPYHFTFGHDASAYAALAVIDLGGVWCVVENWGTPDQKVREKTIPSTEDESVHNADGIPIQIVFVQEINEEED